MKKLDEFQAKNHKDVKSIDENNQSTFKGGRLPSNSFLNMQPIQREVEKTNPLAGKKAFSSWAEFRASMFGGK